MPLSHLCLSVSHLPAACSFYLSALQPLGYRYLGRQQDHLLLGVSTPNLLLHQASRKPSPTHLAFDGPSASAVDAFFAAALRAGASVHEPPTAHHADRPGYGAAVLDLDGNSVEVVYRDPVSAPAGAAPSVAAASVLSTRPSSATPASAPVAHEQKGTLRSIVDGVVSVASVAKPLAARALDAHTPPPTPPATSSSAADPSHAIVGTLLGAAAGATIAYAMIKADHSHHPSSRGSPLSPDSHRASTVYRSMAAADESHYAPPPSSSSSHHRSYPKTTVVKTIRAGPPLPSVESVSHESSHHPKVRGLLDAPPPPSARVSEYTRSADEYAPTRASRHSRSAATAPRGGDGNGRRTSRVIETIVRVPAGVEPPPLSALHMSPADFPLPQSSSGGRSSRHHHHHHTTTTTSGSRGGEDSGSRGSPTTMATQPEAVPLPSSHATASSSSPTASSGIHRRSRRSRRAGSSSSPSAAGSASTITPLTAANVESAAARANQLDDLPPVTPGDSVSQVSTKYPAPPPPLSSRKHHHHSSSSGGHRRSSDRRSAATDVPRERKGREKQSRSLITALRIGGRS